MLKSKAGKRIAGGMAVLCCALGTLGASAQTVSAVPALDLNRFTGTWYELAHLPSKSEKQCTSNVTVLYALGDKTNTFQMGTFCLLQGGTSDEMNSTGKMGKAGDGELKINRIWPLTRKYWVLALGPSYEWALVGAPNRKSLWILSRVPVITPELHAQIEAKATAQGFDTSKLIKVEQH